MPREACWSPCSPAPDASTAPRLRDLPVHAGGRASMRTSRAVPATGPVATLALLAMLAFAANSLLCRVALDRTAIDPASFTAIRLGSGAVALALLLWARHGRSRPPRGGGDWISALALFAYAAGFSLAYVELAAGTGALLLFGAVQATMIGAGLWRGERFGAMQWLGLLIAIGGLLALLAPGIDAPAPRGAALMLGAGVAWGVYSLRGARAGDALARTAGNFLRAAPLAMVTALLVLPQLRIDTPGLVYAVASGALASGCGYAIWHTVLPRLAALRASVLQLSVPAITALGGALLLGEGFHARLLACTVAVLGGVALVVLRGPARPSLQAPRD
jgi:drug/metabolite transporter (DMT)-like permease